VLSIYVDALERQRRWQPDLDDDVKDAALEELLGVGSVVFPVDGGRWTLYADRDEDGPFISASFAPS
jgi:hypothetical protein